MSQNTNLKNIFEMAKKHSESSLGIGGGTGNCNIQFSQRFGIKLVNMSVLDLHLFLTFCLNLLEGGQLDVWRVSFFQRRHGEKYA